MTLEEILTHAIEAQASDIHVEQRDDGIYISTRKFGLLTSLTKLTATDPIINRIKVRANLDLSESRRTQEG